MISFNSRGDFRRLNNIFERLKEVIKLGDLDKYGREGVEALKNATPVESGKTANSWYYTIKHQNGVAILSFHNSNVVDGVNIAVILQYGHGTRNGAYVRGIDYINPAIQPIFEKIAQNAWKEVVDTNGHRR